LRKLPDGRCAVSHSRASIFAALLHFSIDPAPVFAPGSKREFIGKTQIGAD
jgi:hypothetical protein